MQKALECVPLHILESGKGGKGENTWSDAYKQQMKQGNRVESAIEQQRPHVGHWRHHTRVKRPVESASHAKNNHAKYLKE